MTRRPKPVSCKSDCRDPGGGVLAARLFASCEPPERQNRVQNALSHPDLAAPACRLSIRITETMRQGALYSTGTG